MFSLSLLFSLGRLAKLSNLKEIKTLHKKNLIFYLAFRLGWIRKAKNIPSFFCKMPSCGRCIWTLNKQLPRYIFICLDFSLDGAKSAANKEFFLSFDLVQRTCLNFCKCYLNCASGAIPTIASQNHRQQIGFGFHLTKLASKFIVVCSKIRDNRV